MTFLVCVYVYPCVCMCGLRELSSFTFSDLSPALNHSFQSDVILLLTSKVRGPGGWLCPSSVHQLRDLVGPCLLFFCSFFSLNCYFHSISKDRRYFHSSSACET